MLPKNRLRDVRLNRLHIFPEEKHPYENNIIKYAQFLAGCFYLIIRIYDDAISGRLQRLEDMKVKSRVGDMKVVKK